MPRVKSAGALATILRDADSICVSVRLFAKFDTGFLAIDRNPQSFSRPMPSSGLRELEADIVESLRSGQRPVEHRRVLWRGVIEALGNLNVHADAETLSSLDFDLVVADRELRQLLER